MLYKKLSLLLFFIVAFPVISSAQETAPTPPENADKPEVFFTEEIKLNVSAFNREGDFVSDVSKDDLVISEDGRLHQADSLRRIPANVLIVLDTGGELRQVKSIDQTRKVASSLINQLLPQDSVAVLQYFDKADILLDWTQDKQKANQVLTKDLNFGRHSVFVDALNLATEFLQKSKRDNLNLVLVTDGTDSIYEKSERDKAMRKLLASSISVHVISYTQLEYEKVLPKTKSVSKNQPPKAMPDEIAKQLPNGMDMIILTPKSATINTDKGYLRTMRERKEALEESERFLNSLASDTSGLFILPSTLQEMVEKTKLVANAIDSNYVLTYTPKRPLSESLDGEVREIVVTSKRPGLQVESRRKLIVLDSKK